MKEKIKERPAGKFLSLPEISLFKNDPVPFNGSSQVKSTLDNHTLINLKSTDLKF